MDMISAGNDAITMKGNNGNVLNLSKPAGLGWDDFRGCHDILGRGTL